MKYRIVSKKMETAFGNFQMYYWIERKILGFWISVKRDELGTRYFGSLTQAESYLNDAFIQKGKLKIEMEQS